MVQSFKALVDSGVLSIVSGAINLAIVLPPLILLELVFPRGVQPSLRARLQSGVFWVTWLVAATIAIIPARLLLNLLGIEPILPVLAPSFLTGWVGALVAAVAAAFVGDFFQYWSHRAFHQVRFLWRFHAMHHSVRNLHAAGAYHHFGEVVLSAFLYSLPLSLLTRDPFAIPILVFILGIHGNYLHAATRLHFGPFNRVLMDNRLHRIHHSLDPAHFDKNFGNFSPLWDVVFRTAYFPKPHEWPDTGLVDQPEPDSVVEFLVQPFRAARAPARGDASRATRGVSVPPQRISGPQ